MINKNHEKAFQKATDICNSLSFYNNIAFLRLLQNFAGSNLCRNFALEMIQQALLDAFSY